MIKVLQLGMDGQNGVGGICRYLFEQYKNLDNLNQKILITNDIIDYSTSTIKHIKLEDFLMMEEL